MNHIALLGVLFAACGGDGVASADAGEALVELGSGDVEFEALTDGTTIQIIQGPQGGFHFLGSVRVRGISPGDPDDLSDPGNPITEFRVFQSGVRVDSRASRYQQGLVTIGPGEFEMIGRLIILDIANDSILDGAEVRFEVEVTGMLGANASDTRTLTGIPHPANL